MWRLQFISFQLIFFSGFRDLKNGQCNWGWVKKLKKIVKENSVNWETVRKSRDKLENEIKIVRELKFKESKNGQSVKG